MQPVRLLLVAMACAAALPAVAQTVRVKSGEHEDFSRLVFYFPERPDYEVVETDGGYELRADGAYSYDVDGVFRLIPRDRIAGLGMVGGALRLDLACECSVEVVDYTQQIVVLDVKDAPARPAPLQGRPGPWATGRLMQTFDVDADDTASSRTALSTPAVSLPGLVSPTTAALVPGRLARLAGTEAAPATEIAASLSDESRAFAEAIVGDLTVQIGRAAAQGLLEPDLEETRKLVDKATPKPAHPEPAKAKKVKPAPPTSGAHVSIQTSMDRDLGDAFGRALRNATGSVCLPDSAFDVMEWKVTAFDGNDIARYRAKLLTPLDVPDPTAVRDLARHLLALTFGAEAAALLEAFPEGVEQRDLLLSMAAVVDHGQTTEPGPLDNQLNCETAAALWAALARSELPSEAEIATNAVLKSFSALPLHLRRHLGPELAERFLAARMPDVARSIRNAIARAPGHHGDGFEMLEVQLDLETGAEDEADVRLDALAETGRSAEALALALERQSASGAHVDADVLSNAAALAHELKGSDMGARLKRAELGALTTNRDYETALDVLRRAVKSSQIRPEAEPALTARIYGAAAKEGGDAAFLRLAFRADKVLGVDEEARQVRRDLASRLLKHRLGEQARNLVSHPDLIPTVADRIILAEAALYAGNAEVARGYVMGLTEPAAKALQDRIEAATRDSPLGLADTRRQAAEAAPPVLVDDGLTLKKTRNLLDASTAARTRLQGMLSLTGEPAAEG